MIAVLLVTAMLVPFSFFSKEIWYTDDTIAIYNYVGKKTDTYSIKDADGIEITTYRQLEFYEGGGRKAILPIPIGASYHVKVYIYFGNKYFVVGFSDKHRENYKEDLEYMLHLKNMFPESKITLDIRDLSDVKNRIGLNEEEKKLLDQLIDK